MLGQSARAVLTRNRSMGRQNPHFRVPAAECGRAYCGRAAPDGPSERSEQQPPGHRLPGGDPLLYRVASKLLIVSPSKSPVLTGCEVDAPKQLHSRLSEGRCLRHQSRVSDVAVAIDFCIAWLWRRLSGRSFRSTLLRTPAAIISGAILTSIAVMRGNWLEIMKELFLRR